MDQVWRLVRHPGLLWRSWDDEIVIYNDVSGATHHLDPLAAEIFEALLELPADRTALIERVAAAAELEKSPQLDEATAQVLDRFRSFGLIEAVTT